MTPTSWRAHTDWPLAVAALLFLVAYSVQVILQPDGAADTALEVFTWSVWALFLIDYVVNLRLADDRGRWFVRNLHELVIVLLPMLRPLRLLRLVTLLGALQRVGGTALRGRIVLYVLCSALLLSYVAALAVLDVERDQPEANITSLNDALWWALTTITTVGYGDQFPVTAAGRLIAAALMIGGIAVLGVVTASLASWLVESVAAETAAEIESADDDLRSELREVKEQLRLLTDGLSDHGAGRRS
jgi:voltage-gated potassium channel